MTGTALRCVAIASLLALLLIPNWKVAAQRSPVAGSDDKDGARQGATFTPKGIRLSSPFIENFCPTNSQDGCDLELCAGEAGATCLPGVGVARVRGGTAPFTFMAIGPHGGSISTSPEGNSITTVTFPINKLGTYQVTVTDANGCRVTATLAPGLSVGVKSDSLSRCVTAVLKATVSHGVSPYTFRVTDPEGMTVGVSSPVSDESKTVVTFTATKAGQYVINATDANGCQGRRAIETQLCCSLTQNAWGRNKPKFDGEKRGKTLQKLFNKVLGRTGNGRVSGPNAIVVGVRGERSLAFPREASGCMMERLPASGSPAPLPVELGDATLDPDTCQTAAQLPLANGKFQNELLGQTLALTLNAGSLYDDGGLTYDDPDTPTLWHFVICHVMVTQGALPGSQAIDPGPDGLVGTPDDPKINVTIPTSVINAIAAGSTLERIGKFSILTDLLPAGTVGRLLILANLALAGEPELGGASLADINAALGAVNSAFDGCRFVLSCEP